MKTNKLYLFLALLFISSPLFAQYGAINGYCNLGATKAKTQGLNSTNYLQGVIPQCTVTVYQTGTTNLATIYSSSTGGALANPFLAGFTGAYKFYAASGVGFDISLSGGIPPNNYEFPQTIVDIVTFASGFGDYVLTNPTGNQTITQPLNTIFNFITSGTGAVEVNGAPVLTGNSNVIPFTALNAGSFSAANGINFISDSLGVGFGQPTGTSPMSLYAYGWGGQLARIVGSPTSSAVHDAGFQGNTAADMAFFSYMDIGHSMQTYNDPINYMVCCTNDADLTGSPSAPDALGLKQSLNSVVFQVATSGTEQFQFASPANWTVASGTWTTEYPFVEGSVVVGGANYTVGDTLCATNGVTCLPTFKVTAVGSGGVITNMFQTGYVGQNYNNGQSYALNCISCASGGNGATYYWGTAPFTSPTVLLTSSPSAELTSITLNVGPEGIAVLHYIAEPSGTDILGGGAGEVLDGSTVLTDQLTGSTTITATINGLGRVNGGQETNAAPYAAIFTGLTPGPHTFHVETLSSNSEPFAVVDFTIPGNYRNPGADGPSLILGGTIPEQNNANALASYQYSLIETQVVAQANLYGFFNVVYSDIAGWTTSSNGGTPSVPVSLNFNADDFAATTLVNVTACSVDSSNNVTVTAVNSYAQYQQVFPWNFTTNCTFLNGYDGSAPNLVPFVVSSATGTSFVMTSPSFIHASTGTLTDSGYIQAMANGAILTTASGLHPTSTGYAHIAQRLAATSFVNPGRPGLSDNPTFDTLTIIGPAGPGITIGGTNNYFNCGTDPCAGTMHLQGEQTTLQWENQSGTPWWQLYGTGNNTGASAFGIIEASTGINRLYMFPSQYTQVNSGGGGGDVEINSAANSGNGGLSVYGGGATPVKNGYISGTGVGGFTGVTIGTSGTTITNSNLIPQVGTPTVGQAACIKAAGPPVLIGYCSTVVGSGGACTCN